MNVSKLAKLGEGKIYTINGVELELKSITLDSDASKLLEGKKDMLPEEQFELVSKLVKKMIIESVPDASDEEIGNCMRLNNFIPLIDAFYDVNGLTDEQNISSAEKIKRVIESKQAARTPK